MLTDDDGPLAGRDASLQGWHCVIMGMIQADKAPSDAREIQTEAASGRGNT